jgi:hypothetical protein
MTNAEDPIFPGETLRIWANDLLSTDDGPITSGATVTMWVVDRDGDIEIAPVTATAVNDDWYCDITTPGPGPYRILSSAVYDGKTWKGAMQLVIEPHS